MSDEEIVLSSLSDEDLVKQMHDDLYDGLAPEITEGTSILLQRGWSAEKTLAEALVEGMRIVGIDFRDGILFVPEVLLAANAMKSGMEVLRPLLSESDADRMGKVVIGTYGASFDELIVDGVNGFLVSPDSPDALAEKMISAWTNPNLSKIAEAAKQRMLEFAPEKTVASLLSYYSEVISR